MSQNSPGGPYPAAGYGTTLVDRINLSIQLRRYLKLLARRWLILLFATLLGLSYSIYKVINTPEAWQAAVEVEVMRKVQVSGAGSPVVLDPMDSFYPDQLRIMSSATVRRQVLAMIQSGNRPRLEPPGTAASPSRGQGSSFRLTVECPDPEYARLYASNWALAFLQYKKDQLGKILESKRSSFLQDIRRQQALLDKARDESDRFRVENKIGSASDTYKAAQQQLDQLKSELARVQTERRLLEQTSKEDLASGGLGEPRPAAPARDRGSSEAPAGTESPDSLTRFVQDQTYVTLRGQLNEKTLTYGSLTNTLKPKHPEMVRLAREIEQIGQRMAFQLHVIEGKRKAAIQAHTLTEQGLAQRIQELSGTVLALRGVQDEYDRLKQEEGRMEAALASLKNTLQQVELSTPEEGQFSVVGDPAVGQIFPQRGRVVAQGVGAGFLLGLALIYLLNRLDDRLELAEDIERELQEPILGQIPQVDMRSVKEGFILVTHLHRHNMFAESIRGVRSAIMLGPYQGRKQALLVSSAVPGDGKTTFTVNFAATLALAGNRVLLVDADLRRGNVHTFFGRDRGVGLAEILQGKEHWSDVALEPGIETLRAITTGALPAHPGELLVSPLMQQFIEEARREFDYLIVDCPPLTALDDTFCLLGLMDGLLFVVRSGRTSMRFAKTALAAVRQQGANTLGIVLNGITSDNPYYYYNYYYHAYYNRPEESATGPLQAASARQMAAPKRSRLAGHTILGEAMTRAGQVPLVQEMEKAAAEKARFLKARRAARKPGAAGAPAPPGAAPVPAPTPPAGGESP